VKPRLVIVIGPTAVGKSSILDHALRDFPALCDIITYTTRPMRAGESEGNPYHFVTEQTFKELIASNTFIEWAIVHGNMYGTPRTQVEATTKNGKVCIMDIDVQGAKKLISEYPNAVTIFLKPPSMDALRHRFIKRGITSEADLAKRLESARVEMAQAEDFQHVIINDDFDSAYAQVRKIIENLLKNQ
jgi:guanylate kinase